MRIALIGGGASGMSAAYLLDRQGHHVTVFEREPMLGGHIRTLNKNVKPNRSDCSERLESGVLEFPDVFHNFVALMKDLDIELLPVNVGSSLFPIDGSHFLSGVMIDKNYTGIQRWIEYLRFDSLYARSFRLWIETRFSDTEDFYNQPLSKYIKNHSISNIWIKLLTMYSYSMPFKLIDDFPAELALPMLRDYISVNWLRVEGGVYSYIEKILARFKGEIILDSQVKSISRTSTSAIVDRMNGDRHEFDTVVFATPPDQVMTLLTDPSAGETKRFSPWQANHVTTIVHHDTSMYDNHNIHHPSEFDFFQTNSHWGYNGYLNQLSGVSSPQQYFLSFELEELIAKDKITHIQNHHTPLYTTESFQYRDEIVETNGENNTYYVGAYLGDGLHEGAITSAFRVASLIG